MAEPSLGSLPWKQGRCLGRMALCSLSPAPWEPRATSQQALLRCRKGPSLSKVGIQQVWAGQLCRGWALSRWLGHPEQAGEHVPSTGPCLEARLMTLRTFRPASAGNWLRAGPLVGILPMLTHQSGGGRSEKLKKS